MSALDLIVRASLDKDAADYCRRSGAQDKRAINAFVRGVKFLGLWESMVCWPLRSSQNAGTGTTAYSLGGLGTFDGTLVDGPTWGVDGVNFADDTTQHILTTLTPPTDIDLIMFAAFQCNAQGTTLNAVCGSRGDAGGPAFFSCFQSTANQTAAVLWGDNIQFSGTAAVLDGSYATATFRFGGLDTATKTAAVRLNTLAEVAVSGATTLTSTPVALVIGAETIGNSRALSGNLPFLAYIRASSINNVALRDLYKSTLGTGLGLP